MKKIFTELKIKPINILLSLIIVWVGFALDVKGVDLIQNYLHAPNLVAIWVNVALVFFSAILGLIVLLKDAIKEANWTSGPLAVMFSKPKWSIWKIIGIILLTVVIMFIVSASLGIFEQKILKITTPGNPAAKNVSQTLQVLPFLMVFEEAWTAVMLISIGNVVYRSQTNKSYTSAFWIASLGSVVLFALGHLSAYWNGNLLQTVIHVLLIQGVSRIILNLVVLKSKSFLLPLIIHTLFDTLTFSLGYIIDNLK